MRTTLTLDDDVAAKLKEELRRRDGTFKQLVNDLLREGLLARRTVKPRTPFKVQARVMGQREGLDYDNIGALLEQVEGTSHR